MSQKMMRTPQVVVNELTELSKQYGVDRKVLLNAAMVILKCIMVRGAISIDIVGEDGERQNIPVPLVFESTND